jgi:hypothetical protein
MTQTNREIADSARFFSSLLKLFWATPAVSNTDRPSSLLGKAASAEGPNTAARRRGNGELPCWWSEHRPARDGSSEMASGITALPREYLSQRLSNLADDLVGIATGELIGVSQPN